MGIEELLTTWRDGAGGAEISNTQPFLIDVCRALDVEPPQQASCLDDNAYVFERRVRSVDGEGAHHRIDLYKRDCFILEAKQSRKADRDEARLRGSMADQGLVMTRHLDADAGAGRARGWNRLMQSAMEQARGYVSKLPPDHPAPPFLIACDVGLAFEVWADFSGTGRGYAPFPDRRTCRIFLEDLRDPAISARLEAIWTDPYSLDPSRRRLRATREIAEELGHVWRTLDGHQASEEGARFLMRCILTMFACSVELLPQAGLTDLLGACIDHPRRFQPLLGELWKKMNDPEVDGRYFPFLDVHVPYFGGELFHHAKVFDLSTEAIKALLRASERAWNEVEPALFGSFLEGALDVGERRRLGAHYTPRRHVERVVEATVMTPLREAWRLASIGIETARDAGDLALAQQLGRRFYDGLRHTRVLDPACGTGNFLYVAMELLKTLEGQVLETLALAGCSEVMGLDGVDPGQFLGLEINPRSAVIAELVLWIGFLQIHYRTHDTHPAEPILRASGTIRRCNAVVEWAGHEYGTPVRRDGATLELRPDPRRPEWPQAEFIIGNPPFMGGKDLRARLGDGEAEALWAAHPQMNRSADLVMYWWDHAAELLAREGTALRRFGLVTTNSIRQPFQRQTVARHLHGERPIHLAYVVPDHPWANGSADTAAVRVAMTVAEAGVKAGVRLDLVSEAVSPDAEAVLVFRESVGRINSDLSIGPELTRAEPLLANRGLCSPGVKLHGAGFIVSLAKARELGLGCRPGLQDHIHPYRNGRDIVQQGRDAWVIDLYPLDAQAVRTRFPEVYQHLLATVKPHRDANRMAFRRDTWWWFGATHEMYRSFIAGLERYIVTPETAKHRVFTFLPRDVRADNMLVSFGLADAFHLGVLSSRVHVAWAMATGGVLEDRPRYTKSACFDPFPFPDPSPETRQAVAAIAEELDATRAQVQAEHGDLTLTTIYNALDACRGGGDVDAAIMARARIAILAELHERLDAQVLAAYGWPAELPQAAVLDRLGLLNAERRVHERAGRVLWLRPPYQAPRFAVPSSGSQLDLSLDRSRRAETSARAQFPRMLVDRPGAVLQMLERIGRPVSVRELSGHFSGQPGGRLEKVAGALLTLARYGRISVLEDGRCLARRTA